MNVMLDEERLFNETIEKMMKRIPERWRNKEVWTVAITAKFLCREQSAVRRMIAERKIFAFKNCGIHEVNALSVVAYLRRQNGIDG